MPQNKQPGLQTWDLVSDALKGQGPASVIGAAATIAVETAHTFLPITEFGDIKYFHEMYGHRKDYVTDSHGLWLWRGRGLIQLTGLDNYKCAEVDLKIPLTEHPGLALEPANAVKIFWWYWNRHRLPYYCRDSAISRDWKPVRRAVNGGINGFQEFEAALEELGAFG